MIGRLSGTLIGKQPPQLLVEIAGVGYEVDAPMSTFYQLPEIGKQVTLHTHLVIREDIHLLYGFFELRERALFRTLIKVNGVGPKLALTILSSISPDDFVKHVTEQNATALTRLPGVGKKTAGRLVVEMRDRFADWQTAMPMETSDTLTQMMQDAISALVSLGYKSAESARAVKQVAKQGMVSQELIRRALQGMMS